MADINSAYYNITDIEEKNGKIDYFFIKRKINEDQEYLDSSNMSRRIENISLSINYISISMPNQLIYNDDKKIVSYKIEIYGNSGKNMYNGNCFFDGGKYPNFLVKLKGDERLFINITPVFGDDTNATKLYLFVDVPKKYQTSDEINSDHIIQMT